MDVSIVIITTDKFEYTKIYLDKITEWVRQSTTKFELILVDNGSKFQDEYKKIYTNMQQITEKDTFIFLDKEYQYVKALNTVLKYVCGKYTILLHNDVMSIHNWPKELTSAINKTSIIIPVYNNIKYTKDILDMLTKYSDGIKEIIVINNASTDDTKEYLKNEIGKNKLLRVINLRKNKGYPGSCNEGAKIATGDFLLFFNNDVIVENNFVNKLQDEWREKYILGVRGGVLNNFKFVNFAVSNVDYVEGWCLFIKKTDFEFLNGYDEQFGFGLCEDSDLCLRAKQYGYKLKIVQGLCIKHLGNKTLKDMMEWKKIVELSDLNNNKLRDKWQHKDIIVKRLHARGDVLLATPIIRALKAKYPNSNLKFLVYFACKSILKCNPFVDKIIYDVAEINEYFKNECDIKMHLEYEHNLNRHIIDNFVDITNVNLLSDKLDFFISKDLENWYIKKGLNDKQYVAIHTGQSWPSRLLEYNKFIDLLQWVRMKTGLCIVELGNETTRFLDVGKDLRENNSNEYHKVASIIKHAKYFIGIDSFLMHIAQAFDIPGIVPFTSIDPSYRLTKNSSLIGLKNNLIDYKEYNALEHKIKVTIEVKNDITVERMQSAFKQILKMEE